MTKKTLPEFLTSFFSVYDAEGGGKEMFFRCRREEKMVYSESEKVFYRKPD